MLALKRLIVFICVPIECMCMCLCLYVCAGVLEPSSPAGPAFEDERNMLLGNDGDAPAEEEGEGEELFGDNFER